MPQTGIVVLLFRSALAARRRALGPEHKSTVFVAKELAATLRALGKGDEAELDNLDAQDPTAERTEATDVP